MASPDALSPTLEIIAKIEEQLPKDNARLTNYVAALKESVAAEEGSREALQTQIAEFEQAYTKLTAPANRIGVFLSWNSDEGQTTGNANVLLGDQEFVTEVDPKIDPNRLIMGSRVRLNDAYAIVGFVAPMETGAIVKVSEALADGRLRIGGDNPQTGGGRIVLRAATLGEVIVKAGDEVRLDTSGQIAVEHLLGKETQDYFLEKVPELPWEKVGGQQDAIKLIRETIEIPMLHPEAFKRFEMTPVKGILLYGPPGNGKTLIGKAIAYNLTKEYAKQTGKEVKEYFMAISGPKILNMWLGETERMVREIFKTAREKAAEGRLVFIFMDEAESILRTRSNGRMLNISNTVVPQFCAELDGLQNLDNVVLMLTSNRPDYIDPAVLRPGRIDRKVKIGRPDKESAVIILGIYLHSGIPIDPAALAIWKGEADCARKDLIEATIEHIWAKRKESEFLNVSLKNGGSETLYWKDLISGAVIKSVVDRAKDLALKRSISEPAIPHGVSIEDLKISVNQEFKENEIFPKTDALEDWLQLLDLEPENVVRVRPIGRNRGAELAAKTII